MPLWAPLGLLIGGCVLLGFFLLGFMTLMEEGGLGLGRASIALAFFLLGGSILTFYGARLTFSKTARKRRFRIGFSREHGFYAGLAPSDADD